MTDFLNSLKADLLDRRLLPILALVGVGLVAALAYAVLGGGSKATTTPPVATAHVPGGIAVSESKGSPVQSVAETTSGASAQRRGYAHDPFSLLPGAAQAVAASTAATTTRTSSSTTTSGSPTTTTKSGTSTPAQGESKSTATPMPTTPPKTTTTVYHVSVLFGVLPAVAPPPGVALTPYTNLKLLTPLPSARQPLIIFRGVTAGGKNAIFTVVGEVILRGNAVCLPSASQCQEIELKPGQTEQLEYLQPNGQAVNYELRIVSVAAAKASSAAVARMRSGVSQAGRALLRDAGLVAIPGLRFSSVVGVLTYVGHPASAARAHSH
jgi:hypothetical protein